MPLEESNIKIYYRAFMTTKYKESERILKSIINDKVTPTDDNKKIKIIAYYKNNKTKNLLTKNHPRLNKDPLKKRMVV